MKLSIIAAVVVLTIGGAAQAQTSCNNIGNVTLCSDGSSSTRIGNNIEYYSNGQSRTRVGDVDFYSAPPMPTGTPTPMPPIYSPTFPGR